MALKVIKKTDRYEVVHTLDPDVQMPEGEWEPSWIAKETPGVVVSPGATVAEIRPLDALEVSALGNHMESSPVKRLLFERIEAAEKGLVSVSGFESPKEAVQQLPQQYVVQLGNAVMSISLGLDDPLDPIRIEKSE